VKRFVKEKGHADGYEGLTIEYEARQPPRLIMLNDAGEATEYIHLKFMTTEECHELVQSRGFKRRADAGPIPEMKRIPESGAKAGSKKEWRTADPGDFKPAAEVAADAAAKRAAAEAKRAARRERLDAKRERRDASASAAGADGARPPPARGLAEDDSKAKRERAEAKWERAAAERAAAAAEDDRKAKRERAAAAAADTTILQDEALHYASREASDMSALLTQARRAYEDCILRKVRRDVATDSERASRHFFKECAPVGVKAVAAGHYP